MADAKSTPARLVPAAHQALTAWYPRLQSALIPVQHYLNVYRCRGTNEVATVNCLSCGAENRESARFCDSCGTALALFCDACQAQLRQGARFCDACGAPAGVATGSTLRPPSTVTPEPMLTIGDQPSSFADGRYQVRSSFGEGGKKKVYLAHDTLLDRDVAFALIKTEGLDEVAST